MWVQSLGQKDPLEEGLAAHSSILFYILFFFFFHVFLSVESLEPKSLTGYSPWFTKSRT